MSADVESLTVAALKMVIGGISTAVLCVVGWFCRDMVKTQREAEMRIHQNQLDHEAHKLYVAQHFQTKIEAATIRAEHREELKRVHERLDTLPQEIANLLRKS